MRRAEMKSIWDSVADLSGRDRGVIYAQRAEWILHAIESDPATRAAAVKNGRIDRKFLCERIECCGSVLRQNASIRASIFELEDKLAGALPKGKPASGGSRLRPDTSDLERSSELTRCYEKIDQQAAEIADLQRQKREAGWVDIGLPDHGCLPW